MVGQDHSPKEVMFMFRNWNFACGFDDRLSLPMTMAGPLGVTLGILQVPSMCGLVLKKSSGTTLCQTKMPLSPSTPSLFLALFYPMARITFLHILIL